MLNNRTGRQIGVSNANTSMKEQAKVVLNQFYKEGLYVAKENASGFSVVKEKITDEQFSYMNSQYDRGDNAGFSPEQLANGERKESSIKNQESRIKNQESRIKNQVSSIKYQVSSIKYQVSSIKYQVSSIKYQVSSIKYQVSSIKYQVSSIKYQ
ncbi:Colicin-E3 immunity protein [Xenorhabdus hominickii]|uniref:Colicin-E3 immunity protein n=1 Tax=Xenorhabdus hominickii TaxID=351679 RepID=A0A2G0Q6Z2_XENHO|nr:Colicin-E3 immunity protein [Xenorhabdus hominickii]